MPSSIDSFRASFTTDIARPARFNVSIPIPLKLVAYRNIARTLEYRCEMAQFPSVSFATTQRKIYGPPQIQPYLKEYNHTNMTFIVTDSMNEKMIFDNWMELINPSSTYDFNYKSDYITPISINQYTVTDDLSYSITLVDAFPIDVGQLDVDWNNENGPHKLAVVFAYHYWMQNSFQALTADIVNSGIATGVDIATQTVSALSSGQSFNPLKSSSNQTWNMISVANGIDPGVSLAAGISPV